MKEILINEFRNYYKFCGTFNFYGLHVFFIIGIGLFYLFLINTHFLAIVYEEGEYYFIRKTMIKEIKYKITNESEFHRSGTTVRIWKANKMIEKFYMNVNSRSEELSCSR